MASALGIDDRTFSSTPSSQRSSTVSLGWWLCAAVGLVLLPWHLQTETLTPETVTALFAASPDRASALAQAMVHGRFWFWPILAALALCAFAFIGNAPRESRARFLIAGGLLGITAILVQAFLIGLRGWRYEWAADLFGDLGDRQFGVGVGALVTGIGFLFMLTDGIAFRGAFRNDRFTSGSVGLLVASIALFTFWPILRLASEAIEPVGDQSALMSFLMRYVDVKIWGLGCVTSGTNCGVVWNTLALATATATAATFLGLCFALIVTRTSFPAKRTMRLLTVLPIITPPFVIGLGLILIFGRSGIVNQWVEYFTGAQLGRWIYGFQGVWLAQVFSFTPTAFLVLIGVVEGISPSMEEASQTLRANRTRTFMTVTLPLMRPGLANAFLVVFIESLADFGNPIVLGGSFGVLSTEIFFAVVGAQADFGRAAALALIMLVTALLIFLAQRAVVGRKSYVSMTGKGDSGLPTPLPNWVRRLAYAIALPWAFLTVTVYVLALAGGFVKVWGRDWTPTLSHYARAFAIDWGPHGLILSGGAWNSLQTTVTLAAIAAPITAAFGLLAAWVLSRQTFSGRTALEFALMLTFAVPGTVIGVSYILTYNVPPLELTGTGIILVLCFVFRNMPVGVRSGLAAMSQLDKSLDEASMTLRASTFTTLRRVVLPLLKPAIVTALVYSFVRAMTTVSAVIFLVSAQYEMATVYIINRVINGDYGLAIAYSSSLIVLMLMAIGLIQLVVGRRRLGRRASPAKAA
jgi:iron(III) transport system permease protein